MEKPSGPGERALLRHREVRGFAAGVGERDAFGPNLGHQTGRVGDAAQHERALGGQVRQLLLGQLRVVDDRIFEEAPRQAMANRAVAASSPSGTSSLTSAAMRSSRLDADTTEGPRRATRSAASTRRLTL